MTADPLLETWTTPFGTPLLDRIRSEHFPPAFDQGMAEHLAEAETIAGAGEEASFSNTAEALERSGRLLDRARSVFFNLTLSQATDGYQAVERDYAPRLARHGTAVALHPCIFRRIADLRARRADLGLVPDQFRLLERSHTDAVRSGAAHPVRPERPPGRGRVTAGARRSRPRRIARLRPAGRPHGGPGAGSRRNTLMVSGLTLLTSSIVNRGPIGVARAVPIARLTGEAHAPVVPADSPIRTTAGFVATFRAGPTGTAVAGARPAAPATSWSAWWARPSVSRPAR